MREISRAAHSRQTGGRALGLRCRARRPVWQSMSTTTAAPVCVITTDILTASPSISVCGNPFKTDTCAKTRHVARVSQGADRAEKPHASRKSKRPTFFLQLGKVEEFLWFTSWGARSRGRRMEQMTLVHLPRRARGPSLKMLRCPCGMRTMTLFTACSPEENPPL